MGKILRRTFLLGSAAIVGGVAIGYWQVTKPHENPLKKDLQEGQAALTPYVLVDAQGVTIIAPRAEMGQGVVTTLAALVAEELDVTLEEVNVIHGPASKAYFNAALLEEGTDYPATDHSKKAERARALTYWPAKLLGLQATGGSSSIPDAYVKMRKAGAAARLVLIDAAAKKLGVNAKDLKTENGAVIAPDGTRIAYSQLASAAAKIDPPKDPALKPKSEWKLLGKSLPRVDMVAKSTGKAQFAIDVRLPDMLYATVKMNPHLEAGIKSFDASAAEKMPGVKKILPLDTGFAVVAGNTWQAFKAADAIEVEWEAPNYPLTTGAQDEVLDNAFRPEYIDDHARNDGNVEEGLKTGDVIGGEYSVPYLAHATMEPMTAAALLKDGRLEIWAGNQVPTQIIKEAVMLTGLSEDDIYVNTLYLGGGFGRRAEMDFIKQTIKVAQAMEGTPIKLAWSREEDITHDYYRPSAKARFKASIVDGAPHAIDLHLSTTSVLDSQFGRIDLNMPGPDATIVQSAWDQPYGVENYSVTGYKAPMMLPVGSWRSVGASQNAFFHECMLDEIAHAAGADPLQMRLDLMTHEPSRNVLKAAAKLGGWGTPLAEGRARGIAYNLSFGVPTAEVIEIEQTAQGIKIVKVSAAVDVGVALDPRNVEAQVQSAIVYGLSAAVNGEITVEDGKVQQSNFHDYEPMRMYQCPEIEVAILEGGKKIRGIGEPGLPPAAPALANAVFSLTGERIRALPLKHAVQFV